MDTALHEIARSLMDFENEGDYWDYPPELYVVLPPGGENPDKFRLVELGVPHEMWSMTEVHLVINMLGTALTIPGAPEPPFPIGIGDPILAVIIRSEGWGLVSLDAEASAAQMKWIQDGNAIVDHPDRVETRNFTVIADEGDTFSISYNRGDDEPRELTFTEGRVLDAGLTLLRGLRLHYAMPTD